MDTKPSSILGTMLIIGALNWGCERSFPPTNGGRGTSTRKKKKNKAKRKLRRNKR